MRAVRRAKLRSPPPPPPMLLCFLPALSLIPRPVSAQPIEPGMTTTSVTSYVSSSSPGGLDAGNLGSTIGGASAAAAAVMTIALAFVMLRWSRKQNCRYHNKELGGIVPSLPYWKRDVGAETASVDSSELDLELPTPALLHAGPGETEIAPIMRETQIGEPPIYSSPTVQPPRPDPQPITSTLEPS